MKKRTKRFLASLLAALTLIAPLTAPAYADEAGAAGDVPSVSVQPEGGADQTVMPTTAGANGAVDATMLPSGDDASGTEDTGTGDADTDDASGTEDTGTGDADTGDADTGDASSTADTDTGDTGTEDTGAAFVTTFSASSFSLRTSTLAEGEDGINPLDDEGASTEDDQTTTSVVKIGDTTLGTDATDVCWDKVNGTGWRYDGSAVSMVNNDSALEVHAEGAGIDLSLAGFNRISTLYADGDVNITGTGILLIDEIDMLEGTNLNLLTNTAVYADGSVAVFRKTAEGMYELINGDVTGILDEEYTIPAGITLVVPDGGTLDMRVTTEVTTTTTVDCNDGTDPTVTTETHYGFTAEEKDNPQLFTTPKITMESGVDENGTPTNKITTEETKASFFTPVLNIAANAILQLKEGAKLLMQSFQNSIFRSPQFSTLNVSGTLELGGEIEAYANPNDGSAQDFVLNVESGGHVTGSGTITDVAAFYKEGAGNADELNLAGSSYVTVNSSGIGSLNSEGTTAVIYADGVSMGSVSATKGGSVTFYGKNAVSQMKITGSVTGNYTISSGYLTIGGNFANESFEIQTGQETIPFGGNTGVGGSGKPQTDFYDGYITDSKTAKYFNSTSYIQIPSSEFPTSISYNGVSSVVMGPKYDYFEVYTYDSAQGQVTLHLLSENSTETVDRSKVFLIRGICFALTPINEAGSGLGSTNTSNTGSGILGGENAGSFTGGNSNSVLGGNRQPPSGGDSGNSGTGDGGSGSGGSGSGDSGNSGTGDGGTGSGDSGNSGTGDGGTGSGGSGSGDSGNSGTGDGGTGSGDSGNSGTGDGGTGSGDSGNGGTGSGDSGNGGTGSGDSGNGGTGSGDSGNGGTGSGDSGNSGSGSGDSGNGGTGSDGDGDEENSGNGNSGDKNDPSGSTAGNGAMAANDGTTHELIVKVSGAGTEYRVAAFLDGVALQELDGGTVHVTMEVRLEDGWNENDLFAVFHNDKGELVAVKASYDPATGVLVFEAPMLGQFQLVCFHWDGTDYESPAFLAALQAHMN